MLHYAVGEGATARNEKADVKTLQKVLNRRVDLLVPLRTLAEDGLYGPNTKAAILHVQSKVLGRGATPDGLVEPLKTTIQKLWPTQYANPTNLPVRGEDSFGSGRYGAARGARAHDGTDYSSTVGASVRAPISGLITAISRPYSSGVDATLLSGLEIWASNGTRCWVWYFQPTTGIVGSVVMAGEAIGTAQSLQNRYRGITNHVHVRFHDAQGTPVNPAGLIQ